MTTKFCKDCEWIRYNQYGDDPKCASTAYEAYRDYVTGNYMHAYCSEQRNNSNLCGAEARWFLTRCEKDYDF